MKTKSKWKKRKPVDPDYRSIEDRIKPVTMLASVLKVVLYGKAGTGKTTLAGSFPKPALLIDCNEKGTDSVADVKGLDVLQVKDWQDLVDAYWLVRKKGKYKTVIIDTVSNAQDKAIIKVLEDNNKDTDNPGGWGTVTRKEWGSVSTMMKSIILDFRDLEGVNVVFIAHDRVFNGSEDELDTDDGQIMPEVGPRLMPSVASTLNAAVGIIGNTFIRERIREIKLGKKKITKRKVEYCLRVGPHSYYTTKIRKPRGIEAPAFISDPSYDKIVATMKGKDPDEEEEED